MTHKRLRTWQSILQPKRSELQLVVSSCMQYWQCFADLLIARTHMENSQTGDEYNRFLLCRSILISQLARSWAFREYQL